jgi:RNA-directed DNA polymerase
MRPTAIDQVSPLFSENKLASILGVPVDVLRELAALGDALYHPFDLPKKNGKGMRRIDNPSERLKAVQKNIYARLLRLIPLPSCILGGVPGKSVRHNALPHVGQSWVVGLDIEDYFPSITAKHVDQVWTTNLRTGTKTTRLLTRLTTYSDRLPQGAPTSTPLANLVLAPLLEEFNKDPAHRGMPITSWVDDITLSGRGAPQAIVSMARILKRNGFRLSQEKTRIMRAGSRQEVTKVNVNRQPSIGSARKRMVRDILRAGSTSSASPRERGLISHALSISKAQGQSLKRILDKRQS